LSGFARATEQDALPAIHHRLIAETNKKAEEEKSTTNKPASSKTAKVILNDADTVVVTGTPSL